MCLLVDVYQSGTLAHVYGKYRAKNDIVNSISAGFVAGGILGRGGGPKGSITGGLAFAAFSAAIDSFMRREAPE